MGPTIDKNEYVTIAVLCYNSERTVIETLDSIFNQTYKKLDLIICDDGSDDGSVRIIEKWTDRNLGRFRNIVFIKHKKNEGINASFDSVVKQCKTEWIKDVAADDMLLPECIEKNMYYVKKHKVDGILFSLVIPFKCDLGVYKKIRNDLFEIKYAKKISKLAPNEQYKKLLQKDIVFSPTEFFNANVYKRLGGITRKIKNIEDWPLRLLFTSNGYKIHFMDEDTVKYRLGDSVSHKQNELYNSEHIEQVQKLKKLLIYPKVPKSNIIYYISEMAEGFRYWVMVRLFKNKKNGVTLAINNVLMLLEIRKLPERILKAKYRDLKYENG